MTIPPKTVFFISILLTRTPDTVGNLDREWRLFSSAADRPHGYGSPPSMRKIYREF
jgi:hypothetical protein